MRQPTRRAAVAAQPLARGQRPKASAQLLKPPWSARPARGDARPKGRPAPVLVHGGTPTPGLRSHRTAGAQSNPVSPRSRVGPSVGRPPPGRAESRRPRHCPSRRWHEINVTVPGRCRALGLADERDCRAGGALRNRRSERMSELESLYLPPFMVCILDLRSSVGKVASPAAPLPPAGSGARTQNTGLSRRPYLLDKPSKPHQTELKVARGQSSGPCPIP